MTLIWRSYLRAAESLCIAGIALVLVLGGAQVWFRYVAGTSLVWSEELMRVTMLWLVMIGSGLAYSQRQFMGMRFAVNVMPPRMQRACDLLSAALMLSFLAVISWYGAIFAWKTRLQSSTTLDVSLLWVHGAIVVGAALMALHIVLVEVFGVKSEANPHGDGGLA